MADKAPNIMKDHLTRFLTQHAYHGELGRAAKGSEVAVHGPAATLQTQKPLELTPDRSEFFKGIKRERRPSLEAPDGSWSKVRRATSQALERVRAYNLNLGMDPQELEEKNAVLGLSAFTFLRANPQLAKEDFESSEFAPLTKWFAREVPEIWSTMDTHVGNIGFFRGPDEAPVLGVNDFDMCGRGRPDLDLGRLLSSALVMMTERADLPDQEKMDTLEKMAKHYFSRVMELAEGTTGSLPAHLAGDELKSTALLGELANPKGLLSLYEKARKTEQPKLLRKFFACTEKWIPNAAKGLQRIEDTPEHPDRRASIQRGIAHLEEQLTRDGAAVPGVERPLRVVEMFQKQESGGSSRGMERLYLVLAPTGDNPHPILLEAKELMPSPANCTNGDLGKVDAEEILRGQKALKSVHYPLVARFELDGKQFYTRERERQKKNVELASLAPTDLKAMILLSAEALVRKHVAPDPEHPDAPSQAKALAEWIGGEVNEGVKGAVGFAVEYARQTFADHGAFCRMNQLGAETLY